MGAGGLPADGAALVAGTELLGSGVLQGSIG